MEHLSEIKSQLISGADTDVATSTRAALDAGLGAKSILDDALIAGMEVIGERFRKHEIFLPTVLLAARAMYAGLDLLKPHLEGSETPRRGTIVIGTVEGDLHDIGKNLVGIMLRGAGFEVVDLGNSVSPAQFVAAARDRQAQVVGMSALLTTTMPVMGRVIEGLRAEGLSEVKTVIGGAPVSNEFAAEIGADAYGYDAVRSVEIVRGFVA